MVDSCSLAHLQCAVSYCTALMRVMCYACLECKWFPIWGKHGRTCLKDSTAPAVHAVQHGAVCTRCSHLNNECLTLAEVTSPNTYYSLTCLLTVVPKCLFSNTLHFWASLSVNCVNPLFRTNWITDETSTAHAECNESTECTEWGECVECAFDAFTPFCAFESINSHSMHSPHSVHSLHSLHSLHFVH